MTHSEYQNIVGIDCDGLADDALGHLRKLVGRLDADAIVLVSRQPGARETALKGELEGDGHAVQQLASRTQAPAGVRWLLDREPAPA